MPFYRRLQEIGRIMDEFQGRIVLGKAMTDEASYICDACGEEIVVPIDFSAGSEQEYVEDCPVCCRPNVVHIEVDEGGEVRAWAEGE